MKREGEVVPEEVVSEKVVSPAAPLKGTRSRLSYAGFNFGYEKRQPKLTTDEIVNRALEAVKDLPVSL